MEKWRSSRITTIKNWLSPDLIDYLYKTFLFYTPHEFKEVSREANYQEHSTKNRFYSYDFESRQKPTANFNALIDYLKFKINNTFFNGTFPEYERINLNIQFPTMEGDWHTDFAEETQGVGTTFLLLLSPKDPAGGGAFFYKEKDDIKEIEYEQNQLIIFGAKILHRASLFKQQPRVTLAFKINGNISISNSKRT